MEVTKWRLCLKLFLKFLKIGAFTFGGGYAMIGKKNNKEARKKGKRAREGGGTLPGGGRTVRARREAPRGGGRAGRGERESREGKGALT